VTKVVFDSTVTEIEEGAFHDCRKLVEVVLNEGLRKIEKRSFRYCNLRSIKIPSTVIEIGSGAFHGCINLRGVVLNEGLTKIEGEVFAYCCDLERIKLPSTVSEVGNLAFWDCSNLRDLVLNEGLRKIGWGTFSDCRSLESIRLPSTVTEVGNGAFRHCRNLTHVVLNEGIQTIEGRTFEGCTSLENIKFSCISKRLEALRQNDQTAIENKINETPGVDWREGEILISLEAVTEGENWEARESLHWIVGLIAFYELKEATTIFELALWKANIGKDFVQRPVLKKAKIGEDTDNIDNLDRCRVAVPDPVKAAVLQYFSWN
ncbi:hypothetical protein ACHAXR_008899, partial [Thalassiosira sp. AJA248-18]